MRRTNTYINSVKVRLSIICLVVLLPALTFAQGENNNWTFGYYDGINFSTGSPQFFESSSFSMEGAASISDPLGNLLFYSNGQTVWDRNHNPMPNGEGLIGNQSSFVAGGGMDDYGGSTTQGVCIVKSPANPYQYYVFTIDALEIYGGLSVIPKLRYNIVDMSLNNGLGDVVLGQKNIMIDYDIAERMVITHATDCDYWLIVQRETTNDYLAFRISEDGISDPVVSPGIETEDFQLGYYGWGCRNLVGEMKMSPDNKVIAHVNWSPGFTYTQLADFDSVTGVVSNPRFLDSTDLGVWMNYGVDLVYPLSFSPDGSKLYSSTGTGFYQYDMSLYPDVQQMSDNKYTVIPIVWDTAFYQVPGQGNLTNGIYYLNHLVPGATRIGPDGKIYLQRTDNRIAVINNPNLPGAACDFDSVAITEATFAAHYANHDFYSYSMGMNTIFPQPPDTVIHTTDTVFCFRDSVALKGLPGGYEYIWNTASMNPSITVKEDGIYWVRSYKDCMVQIDTFHVSIVKGSAQLGNDTTICPQDSITLYASVPNAHFKWQDGSNDSVYVVTAPGTYRITIDEKGCYYSDTVVVGIYEGKVHITPHDTMICKGDAITLEGRSDPVGSFIWNTGARSSYLEVSEPGEYILQADGVCGPLTDTVRVLVQDCNCRPQLPNAFTPNGDGRNDRFGFILDCVPEGLQLRIYNRMGESVFVSFSSENKWDGTFHGKPCDIGTYYYILKYRTPNGEDKLYKGDLTLLR